jgi:hypothetical protein
VAWKPDYLTLAEAREYVRVPAGDTVDDAVLQVWVTAVSREIDQACNRQFGQLAAPAARVYRQAPAYDPESGLWRMLIDDTQDLTGMTVNGVAYASSGTTLLPDNAPADGRPWTMLGFATQPSLSYPGAPVATTVVNRWGWTAVPTQVPGAARLQLSRVNWRRDAPAGTAGSPESGSEIRLLAKLDPDVVAMLGGLRRRRRVY